MSLGFKIYSFFNGSLVHQDSLGNKFYQDKKNSSKRWIIYADGLGPESIPTNYHNWLHNTSDVLDKNIHELDELVNNIKGRTQKHITTHKPNDTKGYNSWQPK